jgi:splicing factor 3B subunit 3
MVRSFYSFADARKIPHKNRVEKKQKGYMYLYNLTLQKPTGIVCAVYGNFSSPKAQEIVVSRGKVLELLRPDETGKIQSILAVDVFGTIRSLASFRLTGKI